MSTSAAVTNDGTLHWFPIAIYALRFNGHIFTKKSSIFVDVNRFDNRLNYFRKSERRFSTSFDGSRNSPIRTGKFQRAIEIFDVGGSTNVASQTDGIDNEYGEPGRHSR